MVVILTFEVSFHLFNGNIRPPPVSAPFRGDPPVFFTPKLYRRGHEQVLHDQFPLSKYAREIEGEHGWNTPIFVFFVLVEMEGMVDKLVVVKNLNGFQSFWSTLNVWIFRKVQNDQNYLKSPIV